MPSRQHPGHRLVRRTISAAIIASFSFITLTAAPAPTANAEAATARYFASIGKFGLTSASRTDDMLAELAARAAAEHVSYLELMVTTDSGAGAARGAAAGWDPDLAKLRDKLLAAGFRDAVVSAARTRID